MTRVAAALILASFVLPRTVPLEAATRAPLRVPASTAYTWPDAAAADARRDGEVVPFVEPHTLLMWFGRFEMTGTVRVSVEIIAADGAPLELWSGSTDEPSDGDWARAQGTSHLVHAVGTGRRQLVDLGTADVSAPGYVRFELSASNSAVSRSLKVTALVLDGAPSATAHFNLLPRRNAASVHLRYPVDSTLTITGFFNEVTAVDDPVTTYYMATGFARGYFGMQVNSPTERRIIFSVWDAGNGTNAADRSTVSADDQVQLLAKGEGVVAEVFGNEGTGGHSHLVYDWKTGSTQRFYVTAELDGTHTIYSGYWFHPEKSRWMLIARFRAPKDGLGLRRLYSFSEDFGGETGHLRRKARFGPAFVRLADGRWNELTTATFSHDATGRADRFDRFMGVEDGRFFLSHGGFVSGFTQTGTVFMRPATGRPPQIDLPR